MNQIIPLGIKDCFVVKGAERKSDSLGYIESLYNETEFASSPITPSHWQQVSMAKSVPNVLRGIHCSNYAKYVTCVSGEIYDVIVDLRPDSPTYLKWEGVWLSADNESPVHVHVPKRCGHGYFCKRTAIYVYMQDGTYNPSEDVEISPFDEQIGVQWPEPVSGDYVISDKDRNNPRVAQVESLLSQGKLGSQYKEIIYSMLTK
jgi:dTDP-4-dehydrorhamnose 3,5-epimerase